MATIYIAESKQDFIDKFSDNYAMRSMTLEDLRKAAGNMICVRLINPSIQPYHEFDTDDLDEIAKYAYEWNHG